MNLDNERPRFSSVLSRAGSEIAKLSPEEQSLIRDKFRAEVSAKEGKPIDPTAFLGAGATGTEVATAFRREYEPTRIGGLGRGEEWAAEHGPQAFRNFIPALAD